MKTLNVAATKILKTMVEMMDDGYVKIDEGSFMAVSVEEIFSNDKYSIISVAHYFEQNGDLMADPELCFIYIKARDLFMPSYFKMDGFFGREEECIVVENGEIKGIRTKMQADHTSFANTWLKNIKYQQNL